MSRKHRWISPDWSIFGRHTNNYCNMNDGNYARFVSYCTQFSCLLDSLRTDRIDKVHFESIDHTPPCIKYKRPPTLRFFDRESSSWSGKLVILKVNILHLIQLDYDHFLELHPVGYDKVKEAIAQSEIDMPVVSICDEGFPRVGDGRHRLVALHKFGFEKAEVLVPEGDLTEIVAQLEMRTVRKGVTKPTGIYLSDFSLQDFCTSNDHG